MVAGGIAIACLVACLTGAVGVGTVHFVASDGASSATIVLRAVEGAGASVAAVDISKQIQEMGKINAAVEELRKQTNSMTADASNQKMAWQEIQTQAEKIVHYIDNAKMEKNADALEPRRRAPIQKVLDGVHDVLQDVAILQDGIVTFKKEAQRVQESLVTILLMKESDEVLTPPVDKSASLLQSLGDLITGTVKALKVANAGSAVQVMAKSLKLD
ncbi:Hypp983 [Branchiostoma lanceolatum]|uniref:Hypp983 protein n=1 Tax=Branchiostoma lanceolatum TaxID=7740 RepID=A0A8J9ZG43_BRALA|nr:Hypp983 [Branchiostoma lanceolatum]